METLLIFRSADHKQEGGIRKYGQLGAIDCKRRTGRRTTDSHPGRSRRAGHGRRHKNFSEGAAVSVPLDREGLSRLKSFWYGQLSGVVEPIA